MATSQAAMHGLTATLYLAQREEVGCSILLKLTVLHSKITILTPAKLIHEVVSFVKEAQNGIQSGF
jgi:hypothetical protein